MNSVILPYRGMPIELLRPVAQAWSEEARGNSFSIDINVESHLADLSRLANSPSSLLLVLYNGKPSGYIGLEFWPNPLGNGLMASEKYWYVMPDSRGRDSIKLLKAAIEQAQQNGAGTVFFTASRMASDLHDKVCKIYEHFDMIPFETTYALKLSKSPEGDN